MPGKGASIYDAHKEIKVFLTPPLSTRDRPISPLWMSTCPRHEIHITLFKQHRSLGKAMRGGDNAEGSGRRGLRPARWGTYKDCSRPLLDESSSEYKMHEMTIEMNHQIVSGRVPFSWTSHFKHSVSRFQICSSDYKVSF